MSITLFSAVEDGHVVQPALKWLLKSINSWNVCFEFTCLWQLTYVGSTQVNRSILSDHICLYTENLQRWPVSLLPMSSWYISHFYLKILQFTIISDPYNTEKMSKEVFPSICATLNYWIQLSLWETIHKEYNWVITLLSWCTTLASPLHKSSSHMNSSCWWLPAYSKWQLLYNLKCK